MSDDHGEVLVVSDPLSAAILAVVPVHRVGHKDRLPGWGLAVIASVSARLRLSSSLRRETVLT